MGEKARPGLTRGTRRRKAAPQRRVRPTSRANPTIRGATSMDFRLNDEQLQIKTMVREFGESEIKPHLAEWDEAQHFPVDTFKKAGELGLLGVIFPEEYGGTGLSYIDYVGVIEELGAIESGFALSVAADNFFWPGHPLPRRQ